MFYILVLWTGSKGTLSYNNTGIITLGAAMHCTGKFELLTPFLQSSHQWAWLDPLLRQFWPPGLYVWHPTLYFTLYFHSPSITVRIWKMFHDPRSNLVLVNVYTFTVPVNLQIWRQHFCWRVKRALSKIYLLELLSGENTYSCLYTFMGFQRYVYKCAHSNFDNREAVGEKCLVSHTAE